MVNILRLELIFKEADNKLGLSNEKFFLKEENYVSFMLIFGMHIINTVYYDI